MCRRFHGWETLLGAYLRAGFCPGTPCSSSSCARFQCHRPCFSRICLSMASGLESLFCMSMMLKAQVIHNYGLPCLPHSLSFGGGMLSSTLLGSETDHSLSLRKILSSSTEEDLSQLILTTCCILSVFQVSPLGHLDVCHTHTFLWPGS